MQKLAIPVAFINTNLTGQSLVHCVKSVDCKALIAGSDQELITAIQDVTPQLNNLPVYVQGVQKWALPVGFKSFDDLMRDTDLLGAPAPSLRSGVKLTDTYCYIYTSGTTASNNYNNISNNSNNMNNYNNINNKNINNYNNYNDIMNNNYNITAIYSSTITNTNEAALWPSNKTLAQRSGGALFDPWLSQTKDFEIDISS
ncbi:very long-chain acyl-CoA synthetase-like [Elysia marginata]|uniref:Very long-chain acyl-CoA synthetase-like n=1 Tax=Elysia marginata TaxID=1093978 RepID=A0AAV4IU10_9GAST|nr:very long-chain acyl-CoA synthetase-like [Elysia marginata]